MLTIVGNLDEAQGTVVRVRQDDTQCRFYSIERDASKVRLTVDGEDVDGCIWSKNTR